MNNTVGLVSPETVTEALAASDLFQRVSCCGVENKFCNNDQYQGDLWSFAQKVIQIHDSKRQGPTQSTQEPSGKPKYMGIGECY